MLIFRRIQLYTCSMWYCHSLWEFLVACTQAVCLQATTNSHREWQYHILHVYNCILLKMSTWASKHVQENSILWINNSAQKLVIYSQFMMHGQKNIKLLFTCYSSPKFVTFLTVTVWTSLIPCMVTWIFSFIELMYAHVTLRQYSHASFNEGDTFWEMRC